MGGALATSSKQSCGEQKILDVTAFREMATEYDRLKAHGMSIEEIYATLSSRVQSVMYIEKQLGEDEPSPNSSSASSSSSSSVATDSTGRQLKDNEIRIASATNPQTSPIDENSNVPISEALVIDDSMVAAKMTSKILEKLKYKTTVCTSAQDGFDALKQNSKKYAFVMLDIVMPNVDGVECLSWIKDDPQISHVPVFMLSGLEDQTLADVCLERGADAMLLKPLIVDMVKKLLHKVQNDSSSVRGGVSMGGTGDLISKKMHQSQHRSDDSRKILRPGRQTMAFRLYDSNCKEFNYPLDTGKSVVVFGFAPTIFLPNIHVTDGLIEVLKSHNKSEGSKKKIVIMITSDLNHTLAEAKILYHIPFTLLSDPHNRISDKFVGSFDLGATLTASEDIPCIPTVHDCISPVIGMTLVSKKRNVLYSWTAYDEKNKRVDITMLPPSSMEWANVTDRPNASKNGTIMGTPSVPKNIGDSTVRDQVRDSSKPICAGGEGSEKDNVSEKGAVEMDAANKQVGAEHNITANSPAPLGGLHKNNLILIVDDSNISARVAAKKIQSLGYSTEATYNGQLAYDLLCLEPRKYFLVICDICMPICDGTELLKMIKSNSKLSHLPVLMLSSLESREVEKDLLEMGALDIMKKPFENSEFLRITKNLHLMR